MPEIIEPTQFQCRHIFTDGHRCGSPCLRKPGGHEDFCYYHHTSRRPVQDATQRKRRSRTFAIPVPEDRSAIQHSIGLILQKIASNEIDPRRAGLLLYGLQIASLNLPKSRPVEEPAQPAGTVSEITIDPALGPLAPAAELVEHHGPKSSAELMLEKLTSFHASAPPESTPQPLALGTVHAVGERPMHHLRPRDTRSRTTIHFDRITHPSMAWQMRGFCRPQEDYAFFVEFQARCHCTRSFRRCCTGAPRAEGKH